MILLSVRYGRHGLKEKSDIDAQFYTNALENAKLYLAKQDEGIRARREDNRSSSQEDWVVPAKLRRRLLVLKTML